MLNWLIFLPLFAIGTFYRIWWERYSPICRNDPAFCIIITGISIVLLVIISDLMWKCFILANVLSYIVPILIRYFRYGKREILQT